MDIIASHQHGLVEHLEIEAQSLAGRTRDSAQRAVVYHHLADSLGLANGYALLAAEGALAIDRAVADLERAVRRAWWRVRGPERAAMLERVARFGEALRELDRRRCEAALLAYRLVATPGLGEQARGRLSPELVAAYTVSHAARGAADAGARRRLFLAQQRWAEVLIGDGIEEAIAALDWRLGARRVRSALKPLRIPLTAYERADKGGFGRVERRLRSSKALPAAFAANPAQAFFALQRQMADRRRRMAAQYDELSPDDAVRLVA